MSPSRTGIQHHLRRSSLCRGLRVDARAARWRLMWLRRQGLASHTITDAHLHDPDVCSPSARSWIHLSSQHADVVFEHPRGGNLLRPAARGCPGSRSSPERRVELVVPFGAVTGRKRGRSSPQAAIVAHAGRASTSADDDGPRSWRAARVAFCELGPRAGGGLFCSRSSVGPQAASRRPWEAAAPSGRHLRPQLHPRPALVQRVGTRLGDLAVLGRLHARHADGADDLSVDGERQSARWAGQARAMPSTRRPTHHLPP